jgi:hypothetical protein
MCILHMHSKAVDVHKVIGSSAESIEIETALLVLPPSLHRLTTVESARCAATAVAVNIPVWARTCCRTAASPAVLQQFKTSQMVVQAQSRSSHRWSFSIGPSVTVIANIISTEMSALQHKHSYISYSVAVQASVDQLHCCRYETTKGSVFSASLLFYHGDMMV